MSNEAFGPHAGIVTSTPWAVARGNGSNAEFVRRGLNGSVTLPKHTMISRNTPARGA